MKNYKYEIAEEKKTTHMDSLWLVYAKEVCSV